MMGKVERRTDGARAQLPASIYTVGVGCSRARASNKRASSSSPSVHGYKVNALLPLHHKTSYKRFVSEYNFYLSSITKGSGQPFKVGR